MELSIPVVWAGANPAPASTVTDGIFLPTSQEWDTNTVFWNANDVGPNNNIQIDLGNTFKIDSFIVQADDNDDYAIFYKNLEQSGNAWNLAWDVPAVGGWGLQTRPDNDNITRYILPTPIVTNQLEIYGGSNSDGMYAVSEVQAFGNSDS